MNYAEYSMLENRFKHLSKIQKFEYESLDWAHLAARLDHEDEKKKTFYIPQSVGIIWLLLIGTSIMYSLSYYNISNNPNYSNLTAEHEQLQSFAADLSILEKNLITSIQNNNHNQEKSNASFVNIESRDNNIQPSDKGTIREKTLSTIADVSDKQPVRSDSHGTSAFAYSKSSVETSSNSTDQPISLSHNNKTIHRSEAPHATTKPSSAGVAVSPLPIVLRPFSTYTKDDINSQLLKLIKVDTSLITDTKRPRFYVNLNAGIETSQTPLGELSDTDYNLGIRAGYVASSKLVISAGVNYINECYTADGQDYTAPVGFWKATDGRPPDAISAVCDMLDISLGASYHFTNVNSNGLVVHANLNSNFMIREEYNFKFTESQDDWIGIFEGENSTFLSNIELGATYKINTGHGVFLDAGPYLKIPTGGIGHGDVRLSSFGFRLGISLIK